MRKSILSFIILSFLGISVLNGQAYPDFTITDSEGIQHTLYEDYLDQGKTVLIKVFFVNCPPCNAVAPDIQELYVQWGEGQADVQFIELSTRASDDNADVNGYKNRHGLTFPGAGGEGDAIDALGPLLSGAYGQFFGTPSFAVIAPDGTVDHPIGGSGASRLQAINDAIEATGATGQTGNNNPEPSEFIITATDFFDNMINNPIVTLESQDGSTFYPIDISNTLTINDLATDYPGITTPYLRIEKLDQANDKVSAIDLFAITKHILGKELITSNLLILAADANGDNSITALDLFALQRLILGKDSELPNQPSYIFPNNEVELNLIPGQTQQINFEGIKTGDINGF